MPSNIPWANLFRFAESDKCLLFPTSEIGTVHGWSPALCTFRCEVRGYSAALAGKLATIARISLSLALTRSALALPMRIRIFCPDERVSRAGSA